MRIELKPLCNCANQRIIQNLLGPSSLHGLSGLPSAPFRTQIKHSIHKMFRVPVLFAPLLAALAALQAQTYEVTDLGCLGGPPQSYCYAYSINSSGIVVGQVESGGPYAYAVRYSGSGEGNTDLGHLGEPFGSANGINDSGTIVGRASLQSGGIHATLFGETVIDNIDLGVLGTSTFSSSGATAINSSGTIVGWSDIDRGDPHATKFSGTGANNIDLGTLGGRSSYATAINSSGTIVGRAYKSDDERLRAVRFSGTGSGNFDLGTLGGKNSGASAINSMGVIVGSAEVALSGFTHATIFSGTGTANIDLGTLVPGGQSYAYGINSSGIVVGSASAEDRSNHAFIYREGKMQDINSLVVRDKRLVLSEAFSINEKGQIAAFGSWEGSIHAFRLDPVKEVKYRIKATPKPSRKGKVRGTGKYLQGKTVTLIATPRRGAHFVKWKEKNGKKVSRKRVFSFKANSRRTLVAVFK